MIFGIDLRVFRKYMGLVFAAESLIALWRTVRIYAFILPHEAWGGHLPRRAMLFSAIYPLQAIAFAIGAWMIWMVRPSARAWGITLSALQAAWSLRRIVRAPHAVLGYHGVALAVGIVGLAVFLWHVDGAGEPANQGLDESLS